MDAAPRVTRGHLMLRQSNGWCPRLLGLVTEQRMNTEEDDRGVTLQPSSRVMIQEALVLLLGLLQT